MKDFVADGTWAYTLIFGIAFVHPMECRQLTLFSNDVDKLLAVQTRTFSSCGSMFHVRDYCIVADSYS